MADPTQSARYIIIKDIFSSAVLFTVPLLFPYFLGLRQYTSTLFNSQILVFSLLFLLSLFSPLSPGPSSPFSPFSLFLSVSASGSVSGSICLCLSVSVSVYLSLCLCLSLSVFFVSPINKISCGFPSILPSTEQAATKVLAQISDFHQALCHLQHRSRSCCLWDWWWSPSGLNMFGLGG